MREAPPANTAVTRTYEWDSGRWVPVNRFRIADPDGFRMYRPYNRPMQSCGADIIGPSGRR